MGVHEIADHNEFYDTAVKRAMEIAMRMAAEENLEITFTDRLWIEAGAGAAVKATVDELLDRGVLTEIL